MPTEGFPVAAFWLGLFGSLHCVGMCGGIAGALGAGRASRGPLDRLASQLGYGLGRVSTYSLAGGLVGGLGFSLQGVLGAGAGIALRLLAGAGMIAAGLYLGGYWLGLARLESRMSRPWRRVSALGRALLPADRLWKLLLLGALWGCLPCGLVYAALSGAMATGGPAGGGAWMAAFGLGTLPAMIALGSFGSGLRDWAQRLGIRRLGAGMILIFGLWTVAGALAMRAPDHASMGSPHTGAPRAGTLPETRGRAVRDTGRDVPAESGP